MATIKQMIANIANAQHSTGPTTDDGKNVSSKNALKHGLTAATVLLPGEDEAAYNELCQGMKEYFTPDSVHEEQLVLNLCDAQWRLNRCPRLEADALSKDVPDYKALDVISKHEARLRKLHSQLLRDLQMLHQNRRNAEMARLEQAKIVRRADLLKGMPTNFKELGFDFSVEDVDAAIRREDTLRRAQLTISQPGRF